MKSKLPLIGGDQESLGPEGKTKVETLESELVRHVPALRARALFLTQGSTAADDLVQDVIERALLARGRFQGGTNLHAWLNRIMRNLFIDECRRPYAGRADCNGICDIPSPEPPSAPGPLDLLTMADVETALACLCPRDRELFLLAQIEHVPYQELARRFAARPNTIGSRLHRARKELRRALMRVHAARRAASGGVPSDSSD